VNSYILTQDGVVPILVALIAVLFVGGYYVYSIIKKNRVPGTGIPNTPPIPSPAPTTNELGWRTGTWKVITKWRNSIREWETRRLPWLTPGWLLVLALVLIPTELLLALDYFGLFPTIAVPANITLILVRILVSVAILLAILVGFWRRLTRDKTDGEEEEVGEGEEEEEEGRTKVYKYWKMFLLCLGMWGFIVLTIYMLSPLVPGKIWEEWQVIGNGRLFWWSHLCAIVVCLFVARSLSKDTPASTEAGKEKKKPFPERMMSLAFSGLLWIFVACMVVSMGGCLVLGIVQETGKYMADPSPDRSVSKYDRTVEVYTNWNEVIEIPFGVYVEWKLSQKDVWLITRINGGQHYILDRPVNDPLYTEFSIPRGVHKVEFCISLTNNLGQPVRAPSKVILPYRKYAKSGNR
jgi:hypothetical protein